MADEVPFEVLRSRYDDDNDECELVAEEGGLTAPSTEQPAAAVPTASSGVPTSAAGAVKQAAPMAADPTVAPAPGQGAAAEADAEEEEWWDEDEDVEDSDDDEVMAALEWADMREGTRRHARTLASMHTCSKVLRSAQASHASLHHSKIKVACSRAALTAACLKNPCCVRCHVADCLALASCRPLCQALHPRATREEPSKVQLHGPMRAVVRPQARPQRCSPAATTSRCVEACTCTTLPCYVGG